MDDARAKLVTSPSSSKSTRHISANYRTGATIGLLGRQSSAPLSHRSGADLNREQL